jgi:hypothetical protein
MTFNFYNPPQTEQDAEKEYADCSFFLLVDGGWAGFETLADIDLFNSQA